MKIKINFFKPKEHFFLGLARIIFRIATVTFIVLLLIDYILPGFVTNWFNPIWLLIIAIIAGIIQGLEIRN